MDQVRLKKGRKQQQTCIDIATMLLRKGLQVEGSNVEWAARHSHTRDYRTMDFLVHPQQQAQEAAYAALAARVLTVGDYAVPLTMAPCAGPPAGCVQVQLHQLPLEYVRQGCMQLLLQCAGQQGEVRCEFLGGSSWCGDAALSCPAADTVVAWVKPPPGDLLLTKLPSSFQLLDGSKVLINVDGRPATQPSLWKQLSKQYEQKMQEAQQLCAKLARQQEEQRQQQQQQQQPDQPNEAGSDVDMGPAPPLQPSQQQTDNTHNNTATDMQLDEEPAAHMQQQQQQQQQQQTQQQQRQQTQQQQRQQQQQEEAAAAAAAGLPPDPFGLQPVDQHSSWVQERVEEMLHYARERAAEEVEPVGVTPEKRQQLQRGFLAVFATQLQQQQPPARLEMEAWVQQQLGLQHISYGEDSDEEEASAAADTSLVTDQDRTQRQQQQQQQTQQQSAGQTSRRRQQQQQQPTRRSSRLGAGDMRPGFAGLFGTAQQQQRAGFGGGRKGSNQVMPTQQQPATPPAAAPPPPRSCRRGAVAQ